MLKSKPKQWLKYLAYITLLLAWIRLRSYFSDLISADFRNTFQPKPWQYLVLLFFNMGIGSLLGLEYWLREYKKDGRWKINLPMFVIIVLPLLCISLFMFISFISNQALINILGYLTLQLLKINNNMITIAQVMLGYFIVNSFYKMTEVDNK